MRTDRLTWFNDLSADDAHRALLECCSASTWAAQITAARPYGAATDVIRQSNAIVAALTISDLGEALAGHPRIGERPTSDPATQVGNDGGGATAADWSRQEQSGVQSDDAQTGRALAAANVEYERRFGHIYLVCAAGRTGRELLGLLRGRLQNEPEDEWQVVRTELAKINALRLERLLAGPA